MTVETTTRRRFVYGDFTLDEDPGEIYSNEHVRDYLANTTFPELANGSIAVGKTDDDGVQTITFTKRATTKGREDVTLLAALQRLAIPDFPNPLADLTEALDGRISAVAMLRHPAAVETYLDSTTPTYNAGALPSDWRQRCQMLPASPISSIPLGW